MPPNENKISYRWLRASFDWNGRVEVTLSGGTGAASDSLHRAWLGCREPFPASRSECRAPR